MYKTKSPINSSQMKEMQINDEHELYITKNCGFIVSFAGYWWEGVCGLL